MKANFWLRRGKVYPTINFYIFLENLLKPLKEKTIKEYYNYRLQSIGYDGFKDFCPKKIFLLSFYCIKNKFLNTYSELILSKRITIHLETKSNSEFFL